MMVPMIISVTGVVSTVLPLIGLVIAVLLLITRARGSFRVTGIIGAALLVLSMISGYGYQWLIDPRLAGSDDDTTISILSIQTVVTSILTGAGLILLTYAIIAAGRVQKA